MNCFKFDAHYPYVVDVLILIVILALMVWLNFVAWKKVRIWYPKVNPVLGSLMHITAGGLHLGSAFVLYLGLVRIGKFLYFFIRVFYCDGWI